MSNTIGTMSVRLLAQVADDEPVEIGTMQIPVTVSQEPHQPTLQAAGEMMVEALSGATSTALRQDDD